LLGSGIGVGILAGHDGRTNFGKLAVTRTILEKDMIFHCFVWSPYGVSLVPSRYRTSPSKHVDRVEGVQPPPEVLLEEGQQAPYVLESTTDSVHAASVQSALT